MTETQNNPYLIERKFSNKGTDSGRQKIDKMGYDEDYETASKLIDRAGEKFLDDYEQLGEEKAISNLMGKIGDIPFDIFRNEQWESPERKAGERYVTYNLYTYGKNADYSVAGESGYSDEQWFDIW